MSCICSEIAHHSEPQVQAGRSCPMAWIVNKPTEWFEATFLRQELRLFMAGFHAVNTRSGYLHRIRSRKLFCCTKEFYCVVSRIINGYSRACANNRSFFLPRTAWDRGYVYICMHSWEDFDPYIVESNFSHECMHTNVICLRENAYFTLQVTSKLYTPAIKPAGIQCACARVYAYTHARMRISPDRESGRPC